MWNLGLVFEKEQLLPIGPTLLASHSTFRVGSYSTLDQHSSLKEAQ